MTLQYNQRLLLLSTFNLSYLRMLFSTKDNHHATTSQELWTLQPEILRKHFRQTRINCSYELIRQHKEKINRFSRQIFLTYEQVITRKVKKHKNSPEHNLIKPLHNKEKPIIGKNDDLLSGSQRYYSSGERFSLRTP